MTEANEKLREELLRDDAENNLHALVRILLVNGHTSPQLDDTGYERSPQGGSPWWEGDKLKMGWSSADLDDQEAEYKVSRSRIFDIMEMLKGLNREELTELALSMSLCPMHLVDYAICFDDNEPGCYQIRLVHPAHDT